MREGKNKPQRILVVEDDPEILNALNLVLGSAGYEVDILLKGSPILQNHFVKPDLFILDDRLPDVDGLDVCRYLKSMTNYRNIPVFVLSAIPSIRNKVLEAGASLYFEKPIQLEDVVDAVTTTLMGKGGSD